MYVIKSKVKNMLNILKISIPSLTVDCFALNPPIPMEETWSTLMILGRHNDNKYNNSYMHCPKVEWATNVTNL